MTSLKTKKPRRKLNAYEKLKVLGALSDQRIVAAKIVMAGVSTKVFVAFATEAMRCAIDRLHTNQQLIMLLDNSSRHI